VEPFAPEKLKVLGVNLVLFAPKVDFSPNSRLFDLKYKNKYPKFILSKIAKNLLKEKN
jgi:hypothetical protein